MTERSSRGPRLRGNVSEWPARVLHAIARRALLFATLCVGLSAAASPVDTELAPRPYVVAASNGPFYFKMSPDPADPQDRDKGFGYAFEARVGRDDTLRWSTSGWYAHDVFLARDGDHLVRLGNWPRGSEPSNDHLAVGFYKSGQLIKSYSTAELIRDVSRVPRTAGHYSFFGEPPPTFASEPTMLDDALTFRLATSDGVAYVFDVRTGMILSAQQQ